MEKIIEVIFSNFFIVIIVVAGISNLFKKVFSSDFKPGTEGKEQRQFGNPSKKFNIFDFDLEKWLEEQTGQQQKEKPKNIQNRPKPNGQKEINMSRKIENKSTDLQNSFLFSDKEKSPEITLNGKNSTLTTENERQLEVDMSDLQNAVVMAEILGPPRAKRKSFRY